VTRLPVLAALLATVALLPGCIDDRAGTDTASPGGKPCIAALEPDVGSMKAQWTKQVSIGPSSREWNPAPLYWADAEHLARIEALTVRLAWTNNPQGSADFGIALGRDGAFHYWNQQYQASLGPQGETLVLDRATLEAQGWTTGDHLDAGPSVSTGAYTATSPITYELSWEATFQPPPADRACAPAETLQPSPAGNSTAAQAPGREA
jgi:hypothetical protein